MGANTTPGPGLALTPPMGWNSYNTFCCDPDEHLIKGVADAMETLGLKDCGYTYLNIDDGWMAKERDSDGNLFPDPVKFPNGLKPVTDYIHSKGLKAGIYLGCGTRTYGEYPGSLGFEQKDAELIASMGFDLLKYDYRELDDDPKGRADVKTDYITMRDALISAGRPMVFSICEHGRSNPWEWGAGVGHYWRTTCDIKDGFDGEIKWGWGFNKIIDSTHHLHPYAGPGHWNDPDMLIVGINGKIEWQGPGCTLEEYRSHFSIWCLSASPLLLGCDIRNMDKATKEIIMNKELIAVNQDSLGKQGYIAKDDSGVAIWVKPLANGEIAVGLYNRTEERKDITVKLSDIGLSDDIEVNVRDLWEQCDKGLSKGFITKIIAPHDCAVLRISKMR